MPRPGPRPYECVRRAWHSDRHQPIRGSLIQEIFRLANEVHSCATRKNKEWQEKLPFVVLKAEEIMYSKANSEAEYVDLKTLWDRANEAIDTIIRKDDANESEDLLQPCIEAALNLGCIPRRASRSQRHNNPVCYLSSNSKEAADISHRSRENKANQLCSTSMLPTLLPIQSDCLHECAAQFGSKNLATGSEIQFMLSSASKGIHESSENSFKGLACNVGGLSVPTEPCISPNFGRIYSLYYGEVHSTSSLPQSHMSPQEQTRMNAFCAFGNVFDGSASVFESAKTKKLIYGTECDLSLRLGLPTCRSLEHEGFLGHEVDDVGSSSSCDGGKSCGPLSNGAGTMSFGSSILSAREKGFDFFLPGNIDKHHGSYSTSRWRSQRDCAFFMNNACDKNQNVYASGALTDERFIWKYSWRIVGNRNLLPSSKLLMILKKLLQERANASQTVSRMPIQAS